MKTSVDLKAPYSRVLIPDGKGTFFAEILEFPGCYAEGKTPTEAFNNLEKAAKSWVRAASANGQSIPEPSTTPGYSGKVVLRLPKSLHRRAAQYAERNSCSLNNFFTTSIASQVGAEEFAARLMETAGRSIASSVTATITNNFTLNAQNIEKLQFALFTNSSPKELQ